MFSVATLELLLLPTPTGEHGKTRKNGEGKNTDSFHTIGLVTWGYGPTSGVPRMPSNSSSSRSSEALPDFFRRQLSTGYS